MKIGSSDNNYTITRSGFAKMWIKIDELERGSWCEGFKRLSTRTSYKRSVQALAEDLSDNLCLAFTEGSELDGTAALHHRLEQLAGYEWQFSEGRIARRNIESKIQLKEENKV